MEDKGILKKNAFYHYFFDNCFDVSLFLFRASKYFFDAIFPDFALAFFAVLNLLSCSSIADFMSI